MHFPLTNRFPGASPPTMMGVLIFGITSLAGFPAVARQNAFLERPQDRPTLAALTGEAMLLHTTPIGNAILYIEQKAGENLVIVDVTDPAHIKNRGTVSVDSRVPFEFVLPISDREVLVRFHANDGYGILDLHKQDSPTINVVARVVESSAGPILTGSATVSPFPMSFTSPPTDERLEHDYRILISGSTRRSDALVVVRGVRQEVSNVATGTTFLMTDAGLYVVRRPQLEQAHAEEELRKLYD